MKKTSRLLSFILVLTIFLLSTNSWASGLKNNVEFKDVKSTDWFNSTVTKLVDMGGINGYPDNTFRPNNIISAEEFIKITVASLGYSESIGQGKDWAINYINKAIEVGLIDKGEIKETEFNKPICRNRMAKILVKAVEHRKEKIPTDYKDYEKYITDLKFIPEEYRNYVLKSYARELIDGYSDNTFRGEKSLTRAEAATVIIRIYDETERVNIKNKETSIGSGPNVDLWKVPIVGEGRVEIEQPYSEDYPDYNPHNVDFEYMFLTYKPMPAQYQDAENLLKARFGENNSTVTEVIKYIKSSNDLKEKKWTINNQLIRVNSDIGFQVINLQVWRVK